MIIFFVCFGKLQLCVVTTDGYFNSPETAQTCENGLWFDLL